MGRATPVKNEKKKKNILEVPLGLHSMQYLLNSNYEKSAKCNPTFRRDKLFTILLKYWQVSKYSAMLSEFSFPQNKFQMVRLCNGGTKDFVELWEIIIWKYELIFRSDKRNYSQLT